MTEERSNDATKRVNADSQPTAEDAQAERLTDSNEGARSGGPAAEGAVTLTASSEATGEPQSPSRKPGLRSDGARVNHGLTPAAPLGPIPNLLPEGFRPATIQGRPRLDPVTLAKEEHAAGGHRAHRARQKRRNKERAARKQRRMRLERLESVSMGLSIALLVLAPLLIGAVHLLTIIPLAGLSLVTLCCALGVSTLKRQPLRVDLLGWTLIALTGWTFIQAMPLPVGLLSVIVPTNAAWFQTAFEAVPGDAPGWGTWSLRPGEASRAGFGLLAASALYLATFNLFQGRQRFQKMLFVVPAVAGLLVVIGVLQRAVDADGLLLFYTPRDLAELPFFSATFVNPNHLATLLGLSSFVTLGMSLSNDFKLQRPGLVLLFGVCVAGLVMTLSAGALVAWLLGMLAFGALTLQRRLGNHRGLAATMLVVIGALGLGTWAAWESIAKQTAFLAKRQGLPWYPPTDLWGSGWGLALRQPIAGLGRASFPDAFAATELSTLPGRYDYVGNTWLQLIIDYGVPLGAATLVVIACSVVPLGLRRGWKPEDLPVMTGIFAAFTFLGLDAALGFSLEIPGVLLPAIFLLGLARGRTSRYSWTRRRQSPSEDAQNPPEAPTSDKPAPDTPAPDTQADDEGRRLQNTPLRRSLAPMAALALVTLIALPTLPAAIDGATGAPRNALLAMASEAHPDDEQLTRRARHALQRRPVDGRMHLRLAVFWRAAGHQSLSETALKLAREFDRRNPGPWLLTAHAHLRERDTMAALEAYREALALAKRASPEGRDAIAVEINKLLPAPALVAKALPDDDPDCWIALFDHLLKEQRPGRVIDIAQALLERVPDVQARRRVQLSVAHAEAALGRWTRVRQITAALMEPPPAPSTVRALSATATLHIDGPSASLKETEEGLRQHPNDTALLFLACEVLIEHQSALREDGAERPVMHARVDRLLQILRPAVIQQPALRKRFYRFSSLHALDRGLLPLATRDLQRALEIDPDDAALSFLLARTLVKERQLDRAIEATTRALARFPDHPESHKARDDLAALTRQREMRDAFRK